MAASAERRSPSPVAGWKTPRDLRAFAALRGDGAQFWGLQIPIDPVLRISAHRRLTKTKLLISWPAITMADQLFNILTAKSAFVKAKVAEGHTPTPAQLAAFLSKLRDELGPLMRGAPAPITDQVSVPLESQTSNAPQKETPPSSDKHNARSKFAGCHATPFDDARYGGSSLCNVASEICASSLLRILLALAGMPRRTKAFHRRRLPLKR